ncbi:hypothetical protein NDU88_000464 [Pleurodeles waltl]|uniref:Uncharacterized protein n=1 Tax=Pleurodeles waltl TaxID=8319 RepID=A0AAV7TF14_PLEWA|nr:hypothetical protein NDU88_000464 [Pleurodeles waltl]
MPMPFQRRRARAVHIQVGDAILMKDRHPWGKFRLSFEAQPWTVTAVKGTIVTANHRFETVTQNVAQFKRLPHTTTRNSTDGDVIMPDAQNSQGEIPALPGAWMTKMAPPPEELQ